VQLEKLVLAALTDMKAVNIRVLDVRGITDVADTMIIASGTSDRHVRAVAENVTMMAKKQGLRPRGVEGARDGEWVLVDLQDVLVHVMLPRVREFYALEQLWETPAAARKASYKPDAKPAAARRAATGRNPAPRKPGPRKPGPRKPAARKPGATARSARRPGRS
jgi:ribosome-associated protein